MEGGQWDLHIYMSWYREKERGRWVDEQGGIEYSSTFGLESRMDVFFVCTRYYEQRDVAFLTSVTCSHSEANQLFITDVDEEEE